MKSLKAAGKKYGGREEGEEDKEEGEEVARIWNMSVTTMKQNGGF